MKTRTSKRLLVLLTTAAMALALLPAIAQPASAASTGGTLYLKGGVLYSTEDCTGDPLSEATVNYSTIDGALVLSGFTHQTVDVADVPTPRGIVLMDDVNTIRLAENTTNTLQMGTNTPNPISAIDCNGKTLIIEGPGTLEIQMNASHSGQTLRGIANGNVIIRSGANVVINMADASTAGAKSGIGSTDPTHSLTVQNGAKLTVAAGTGSPTGITYAIDVPTVEIVDAEVDLTGQYGLNTTALTLGATEGTANAPSTKFCAVAEPGGRAVTLTSLAVSQTAAYQYDVNEALSATGTWKQGADTPLIATAFGNKTYAAIELWAVPPAITVAAQSGTLTYGGSGSASFAVTATYFATPPASYTLVWYTDAQGTTMTTAPAGLSVNTNTSVVTLSGSAIPAGTYYFRVTSGEVQSDLCTLTVNKATHTGHETSKTIQLSANDTASLNLADLLGADKVPEGAMIESVVEAGQDEADLMDSISILQGGQSLSYTAKAFTATDDGKTCVYTLTIESPNCEDITYTLTFKARVIPEAIGAITFDVNTVAFVSSAPSPNDEGFLAILNGQKAAGTDEPNGTSTTWNYVDGTLMLNNFHFKTKAGNALLLKNQVQVSLTGDSSITAMNNSPSGAGLCVASGGVVSFSGTGTLTLQGVAAAMETTGSGRFAYAGITAWTDATRTNMYTYDPRGTYIDSTDPEKGQAKTIVLQCNDYALTVESVSADEWGLFANGRPYTGQTGFALADEQGSPKLTLDGFSFTTIADAALKLPGDAKLHTVSNSAFTSTRENGYALWSETGITTITNEENAFLSLEATGDGGVGISVDELVLLGELHAFGQNKAATINTVYAADLFMEGKTAPEGYFSAATYTIPDFLVSGVAAKYLQLQTKPVYAEDPIEKADDISVALGSRKTKTMTVTDLLGTDHGLTNPVLEIYAAMEQGTLDPAAVRINQAGALEYTVKTLDNSDAEKTYSVLLLVTSDEHRSFRINLTITVKLTPPVHSSGGTGTATQPGTTLGDTVITGNNTKVIENADGSVTLPNGGSVQVNEMVAAKVPGGTIVAKDGTVTIPENKTATVDLTDANQKLTIPGGSTIAPDGTVTVGNGSTQVDLGNGAKLTANEGTQVTPAGTVTVGKVPAKVKLPGGTNVTLTEGCQVDGKQIVVGEGGATVQGNDGETYIFEEGDVLMFDEDVPLGFYTAYKNPFSDVKADDWFTEAVRFVHKNGLMNGNGDGSFAPNELLNRGMMAQILYNFAKNPATGSASYADVASDAWYADAVGWAASLGIVLGVSENQFAPEENITREQMAVMLYRFCQKMEIELPTVRTGAFADGAEISDYAVEAVNALYNAGILNGKGADAFDPQGNATRAEIAQLLMNFLQTVQ